jgi:hypothetical protein
MFGFPDDLTPVFLGEGNIRNFQRIPFRNVDDLCVLVLMLPDGLFTGVGIVA